MMNPGDRFSWKKDAIHVSAIGANEKAMEVAVHNIPWIAAKDRRPKYPANSAGCNTVMAPNPGAKATKNSIKSQL